MTQRKHSPMGLLDGQDADLLAADLLALAEGELDPDAAAVLLAQMEKDPELLAQFEALTLGLTPEPLSATEADNLLHHVLAATGQAFTGPALQLAVQAAADGALPSPSLASASLADVVAATHTLHTIDATGAFGAHLTAVGERHASSVAAEVAAQAAFDTAAAELAMAYMDGEPVAAPAVFASVGPMHVGEAISALLLSPQAEAAAARAGHLAIQAVSASPAQQATPAAPGFWSAWWTQATQSVADFVFALRVPAAFAGALALVAVAVAKHEAPTQLATVPAAREVQLASLVDAIAPTLLAEAPQQLAALNVVADNTADVEAIDGTGTTMVFSTDASNITVIWLAAEDEQLSGDAADEQGT